MIQGSLDSIGSCLCSKKKKTIPPHLRLSAGNSHSLPFVSIRGSSKSLPSEFQVSGFLTFILSPSGPSITGRRGHRRQPRASPLH